MIRMYKAPVHGDAAAEAGARARSNNKTKKKAGRRTPDVDRPARPWHVPKKPKPFGLSQADLDYLKANTHFDEKEIKGWYKGFKTDCPDGNLSKAKISEVVQLILPEEEGKAFVDQIFRIFDKDGNGSIDFKEFMMATDMTSAGTPEEKLKWTFKLYDKDGSGSIDLSEMMEAIDTLYAMENVDKKGNISKKKAKKVFDALDVNGDGNLSLEEFVSGCLADTDLVQMLTSAPGDLAMKEELEAQERKQRQHGTVVVRRRSAKEEEEEEEDSTSASGSSSEDSSEEDE